MKIQLIALALCACLGCMIEDEDTLTIPGLDCTTPPPLDYPAAWTGTQDGQRVVLMIQSDFIALNQQIKVMKRWSRQCSQLLLLNEHEDGP